MIKIFFLATAGQFIIYQVLFWIIDGAGAKKVLFWQFNSLFGYAFVATLVGCVLTSFGGALVNYALILQAEDHSSNLWYGQFVVWASAPMLFTALAYFQRGISFDRRTVISLVLLFLAMLVRQSK